jgi:transcriptional regulator with XRE-family HTH domain
MEYIGRNIKRFRERLGLSQEQIAEYLGIARESISYYENGKREIPVEVLNKLCDVYGIDLDMLLEEDEQNQEVDIALAFRKDELTGSDLEQIASFQKIVKNYLKIQKLKNE